MLLCWQFAVHSYARTLKRAVHLYIFLKAAMAHTALTGAIQIVKYALMTQNEFRTSKLNRKVYKRMKAQLEGSTHGDRIHKAVILYAYMGNSTDLRTRAMHLLDSKF